MSMTRVWAEHIPNHMHRTIARCHISHCHTLVVHEQFRYIHVCSVARDRQMVFELRNVGVQMVIR